MKRLLSALAIVFAMSTSALAADVTLAWDASPSEGVTGYKVYFGEASRIYPFVYDAGGVLQYTVEGLSIGTTYFFAATAYDIWGNESEYSDELMYKLTGKPLPPGGLTIKAIAK